MKKHVKKSVGSNWKNDMGGGKRGQGIVTREKKEEDYFLYPFYVNHSLLWNYGLPDSDLKH